MATRFLQQGPRVHKSTRRDIDASARSQGTSNQGRKPGRFPHPKSGRIQKKPVQAVNGVPSDQPIHSENDSPDCVLASAWASPSTPRRSIACQIPLTAPARNIAGLSCAFSSTALVSIRFPYQFLPSLFYNTGRLRCQSVSRSCIRATRSNFSSANGGASICKPIGKPALVKPHGMLMPGMPARFALIV